MKINVFGKKMTSAEGRSFYNYFGTLTKKDGSEESVTIKFREEVGNPKNVPCTIEFDKKGANLSTRKYEKETETGIEVVEGKVLWISAQYKETEFVDNSLDDYE